MISLIEGIDEWRGTSRSQHQICDSSESLKLRQQCVALVLHLRTLVESIHKNGIFPISLQFHSHTVGKVGFRCMRLAFQISFIERSKVL